MIKLELRLFNCTLIIVLEALQTILKLVYTAVYMRLVKNEFMPCPFTGPKIFWAGPNFFARPKFYIPTYCGSHKHFVPDKKMIPV